MAFTRHTLPQGKLQRGYAKVYCATCGKERTKNLSRGMSEPNHYCSPSCYQKYRAYATTRNLLKIGVGSPFSSSPLPPTPK